MKNVTANTTINNEYTEDDLYELPYEDEEEIDLLAHAEPRPEDFIPTSKTHKSKVNLVLLILLILLIVVSAGVFVYFYLDSKPIEVKEDSIITYYLDGEKVEEKNLRIDTEYVREVLDPTTGKTKQDTITFYDRIPPVIEVPADGIKIRYGSTYIAGLNISDNYNVISEMEVKIEGVEFDRYGDYDATIEVIDSSGNSRKISTVATVLSNEYIEDGEVKERDFSKYVYYKLKLRNNPGEGVTYKQFEQTDFASVCAKIEDKESFALLLGFADCPWCQDAMPILEEVAQADNLLIDYIDVKDVESCSSDDACEINTDIKDIRDSEDEAYLKWLELTQIERPTVPYLVVYIDGEKYEETYGLSYAAPVRNINEEEKEELKQIFIEKLQYLSDMKGGKE